MTFDLIFGASPDPMYARVLPTVIEQCPDIDPYFLVSADKIKVGWNVADRLGVPLDFVRTRLMADSAGYSITTGGMFCVDKSPEDIAKIYQDGEFPLCVSPDMNCYYLANDWNFELNKLRLKAFYDCVSLKADTVLYDLVHNQLFDEVRPRNGKPYLEFSVSEKDKWLDMVRSVSDGKSSGLGIKILDFNCPMRTAATMLYPWARRAKILHLFGTGSIDHMGAFVYCGRHFYSKLTADATSFTIHTKDMVCMIPDENDIPRHVNLTQKKYDPRKLPDKCPCPICRHYGARHSSSIKQLADANKKKRLEGLKKQLLDEWVAAHNVYIVQKYVDALKTLTDRDLIEFLEHADQKKDILTIKCLDELACRGPAAFNTSSRIVLNPQRYIDGWH